MSFAARPLLVAVLFRETFAGISADSFDLQALAGSTPVPYLSASSCIGATNLIEDTMTRVPINSDG
jgi:hypothetical protein